MNPCRNCGSSIPSGARICPVCSYPVDDSPSQPAATTPPDQSVQTSPATGAEGFQTPTAQAFPVGPPVPRTDGQAVASLVLGILGILFCPLVLSIIAWVMGRQSEKRIEASGGALSGKELAKAGWILGIIGVVLAVLGILFFVVIFGIAGFAELSNGSEGQFPR